ncbi:hypothetical protein [Mesorhizobium caraganae]|uniref:hypothetical protein n=1 Tax=Mesorhizobium caraganae TaxID=483206 RepID=UPI003ED10D76
MSDENQVLQAMIETYTEASEDLASMASHVRSGIDAHQGESSDEALATLTMTTGDWNTLIGVMDASAEQFRELVGLIEIGIVTTIGS